MHKLGFCFLRLPRKADDSIDYDILNPLVDRFLELGGDYFDAAYTYMGGLSEEAIRHGKDVIVMEPVKGGTLANVTPEVAVLLLASPERTGKYSTSTTPWPPALRSSPFRSI